MKLTYWEREFIREGGAKLREARQKEELDNLKRYLGDAAHKAALLGCKPVRGVVVVDPKYKSAMLYPPKTSKN